MGGFGFRTLPNYPPQSEWLVMTLFLCLNLPISMVMIAVAPVADPWIRLLTIFVVWWFAALAGEGIRWRLARARGVPFIGEWDYAQVYVRWGLAEPIWVQWLRVFPFVVVVLIAAHSGMYGVQFWELPLRSWLPLWASIAVLAVISPVILAITRKISREYWRERPPRRGWLYALLAVFLCFSYLNHHPSLAGAATAVGLITPVAVTRYWISTVT